MRGRYLETSENKGMEEIADGLTLDRCLALDVVWEGGWSVNRGKREME